MSRQAPGGGAASTVRVVRTATVRVLLFGAGWWAVAEGDTYGWRYGAVVVVVAAATSLWLLPPGHGGPPSPRSRPWRRGTALARLVGWFVVRSVVGGVDVARRALSPALDVTPGYVDCRLRLPPGAARVAVVDMMSLMPGTLCVELRGDVATVHALDTAMPVAEVLAELEARVAQVAGLPAPPP